VTPPPSLSYWFHRTVTDDTVTLNYVHGSKTDTFEGYTTTPCNLPLTKSATQPTSLTGVPIGTIITVFYESKTINIDGRKQKKNQVLGLTFKEMNGKRVKEEHQAIFYCLPTPFASTFMAFGP
jgi:hypothetical protein